VLNFWATWCPPCRKEIPDFIALQSEYAARGVQFLGIANDEPEQVRSFIKEVPLNYLTLIGDLDGQIGRAYGNEMGALPYTVVIDTQGNIAGAHRGLYSRHELEALLQRLL
jgi:peroxiredoxin